MVAGSLLLNHSITHTYEQAELPDASGCWDEEKGKKRGGGKKFRTDTQAASRSAGVVERPVGPVRLELKRMSSTAGVYGLIH